MKKLERAAGMFCTKPSRVVVRVMGYPFFFSVIYYIRIFVLVWVALRKRKDVKCSVGRTKNVPMRSRDAQEKHQ